MEPKVRFRRAREEDRELAFRIKECAFRPYLEAAGKWDDAKERAGHERRFREQEFSIVEAGGEDVGVVALAREPDGIRLHQLMILPEFQDRGYGGKVMEQLLAQAALAGQLVRLRVMKSNPRAQAFYARYGFAKESETETHTHLILRAEEEP